MKKETQKELNAQKERADDHFASVLAGIIEDIKKMKSRENVMKKTKEYTKELDEEIAYIAYDAGYREAIDDIIQVLSKKL